MTQLNVYKASAGSGKTFRLAVDYLKLILDKEWNYRHILAVTFTNKATAEMKSRVLSELYHLSKGEKTGYLDVISKEMQLSDWEVAERAAKALSRILHDYSRFSITTIDSFFQRVIRSFNRELGINSAYSVELDENMILDEAVDRLILSVEEDLRLRAWLKDFAEEKIREGRGWNLKADILQLGKEIYNEKFKSLNEELYKKLNDKAFILEYRNQLQAIIHQFENTLKSFAKGGLTIMTDNGLSTDDFKGKNRGPAASFQKLLNDDFSFTKTALAAAYDPDAWFVKNAGDQVKATSASLMDILRNAVEFYQKNIRAYNTAGLITDQLYTLGILVDLRKMVQEICQEKGLVLISDSSHFIREIIDDSDTPFIYEKTGVAYNHFMIDEFQDTSSLQWSNFNPLIMNSLSEGHFNLLVGDVKQAIYRWRNGDWKLLAGELEHSLGNFGVQEEVLGYNWRSCGNIIRLNNTVFTYAPLILQQHFERELEEASVSDLPGYFSIADIYRDRVQKIGQQALLDKGYFRFRFLSASREQKEDNAAQIRNELLDQIKFLQDSGVEARQMAILVRTKEEARTIAELFLAEKQNPANARYVFDILSNESLYLSGSVVVSFIISMLEYYLHPNEAIPLAQLNFQYYSYLYPALKELGELPELRITETQNQGMLDFTKAYQPETPEQFEQMDHPDNSLLTFLKSGALSQMLSGKALQEIVYSISEKFNLFTLKDELAYLQSFIDQVAVYERGNSSEVTSFLNWWKDNGSKITIPVSETINAISVMTIHKSKGLEFEHVFIPFCDWSILPNNHFAPLLWCKPEGKPFDQLELVPVRYGKKLAESIFYKEAFSEKFNTYIDNLNLLYVAFTRAKSGLYVWSETTDKFETTGDLLKTTFMTDLSAENEDLLTLKTLYSKEDNLAEYGVPHVQTEKQKSDYSNILVSQFQFSDFRSHLAIRKNTSDFFNLKNGTASPVNKGKIIHEILSGIEHRNQLIKSVRASVFSGRIQDNEAEKYIAEIGEMISAPEVTHWFDGTYKVINERNILSGDDTGLRRPDRMMIGNDELIVIDYKSGELELDKYKYQVSNYMNLLRKCGYEKVKGYLWYTRLNKLVEVA